ncbi:MAG: YbbR-like domain-containing protein [Acidobacteriota bacterium]|nr:YbbR-like domain-containing protein [Thermoanaerobaculaceae bacterium]
MIGGLRELLKEWFPDLKSYAYFIFAVLIAFIYWSVTVSEEKETKEYQTEIKFVNVPEGFSIVGPDAHAKANVSVSGTEEVLKKVSPDDIKIEIDARMFTEGPLVYEITSNDISLPSSLSFVSVFPKILQLQLDRIIKSSIPLKPQFVGSIKGGKVVVSYKIEPPNADVYGAESIIKNLKYIPTQPILLNDKDGDFTIPVVPIVDDPEIQVIEKPKGYILTVSTGDKKIQKIIENVKIYVSRLNPIYTAELNPPQISVMIEGIKSEIEKIKSDDIFAQIDVGGLNSSETPYRIKPLIELKSNKNNIVISSSSPSYVEVLVKEKGK